MFSNPPENYNYSGDDYVWEMKWSLLPRVSYLSNKRIWLKAAYRGRRIIHGPAGESPVIIDIWVTIEEFIFEQLKRSK